MGQGVGLGVGLEGGGWAGGALAGVGRAHCREESAGREWPCREMYRGCTWEGGSRRPAQWAWDRVEVS
jgi:hypothetical protein